MSEAIHKILRRDVMPNGTHIQLEDWRECYSSFDTLSIGAYPIAKNDSMFIRKNETFRLSVNRFDKADDVEGIYNGLINGTITLEELSEHYWDGAKDKYYMGIEDESDREFLARMSANGCQHFNLPKSSYASYGLEPKKADEIWDWSVSRNAADEAARLADEGMDYEKALVFCNVD